MVSLPAPRAGAAGYSPESPEVKALVQKGLNFLADKSDGTLGMASLLGLTFAKAGYDESHPQVAKGVEEAKKIVSGAELGDNGNYALAMAILLLTALDGERYQKQVAQGVELMVSRQKEHGGWGYTVRPTGDTSMTQYAVLSLWEAGEIGIETPVEVWEKVIGWLIRTRDPSGAWGYQGSDSGDEGKAVPQADVRHSMAVAGLGTLYVAADHLRLPRPGPAGVDPDVPSGFQKKTKPVEAGPEQQRSQKVDLSHLNNAISAGNTWVSQHPEIKGTVWTNYYLYAMERYQSFKAAGREGKVLDWYDRGVAYLKDSQAEDGSWAAAPTGGSQKFDTCFAVLFLVRSTKKSLSRTGRFGSGLLTGGRGLPTGTEVELRDGQVKARALQGPAETMLKLLEDPTNSQFLGAAAAIEQLDISRDPTLREQLQQRLRELAGGEAPEAREAAVIALSRVRDLDNVPILIYALSDPDARVVSAARRGLEFISRKFRSLGPEDNAPPGEVAAAIERWKSWYRTLRPDAEFPE